MLRPKPGQQWEQFGRADPYYGVYSTDQFRGRELAPEVRERFFASGETHVAGLLADVERLVAPGFAPENALEYGCGVGRLLVPLAKRARRTVGIDVAPSMLAEARRNCDALGAPGVELVGPEAMSRLEPEFNFVHSALVLQHMPVAEGLVVLAGLARLLRPGGVAAVQLPIATTRSLELFNALMKLALAHNVLNVVRGRAWSYPHMQMNVYDLARVFRVLNSLGVSVVHVKLGDASGGYESCTLLFQR